MTYRQIETSREIRLWITGILGPAIIGGATIMASSPELRAEVKDFAKRKIDNIKGKLNQKKEVK